MSRVKVSFNAFEVENICSIGFWNDLAKLKKVFFSLNVIPLFVNTDISKRDREKYKTKSEPHLRGKIVRYIFGGFSKIFDILGADFNESDVFEVCLKF